MIDPTFWNNLLSRSIIATLLVTIASIPTGFLFSFFVIGAREEDPDSTIRAYIGDSIISSAYGILAGCISAISIYYLIYNSYPTLQELTDSNLPIAVSVIVWLFVGITGTFYRTRHLSE